ncbi:hypothetical protein [Nocardioides sp.]|uniref:hypothetical protein n=1 Tax=Nocardioides sp. TaxID=35761 RepID=UPI003D123322
MFRRAKTLAILAFVATGVGALTFYLSFYPDSPDWVTQEWQENLPLTEMPRPTQLGQPEHEGRLLDTYVTIRPQAVAGVPVDGTYLKTVKKAKRLVWARARYLNEEDLPDPTLIQKELNRAEVLRIHVQAIEDELECEMTSAFHPRLIWRRGNWRLIFQRNCEKSGGQVLEVAWNSKGTLVHLRPAGSHFAWEQSRVFLYPKGPKLSELQSYEIAVSSSPGFLRTPNLLVLSDAGYKINDLEHLARIRPEDETFDMVQAYFFANRALAWTEENLSFTSGNLKIRTQVGYPRKTNASFYFNREVRLGSGDGEVFTHIAWDPSIVIHEIMHAVIESLTGLPFQGEGGSLQEGLADTLTALQLDSPNMGEAAYKKGPYQRTLENEMNFPDRTGGLYHDSLILSGMLWSLKTEVAAESAQDLTIYLLSRLTPDSGFEDTQRHVQTWLEQCSEGERCDRIGSVLSRRGWL